MFKKLLFSLATFLTLVSSVISPEAMAGGLPEFSYNYGSSGTQYSAQANYQQYVPNYTPSFSVGSPDVFSGTGSITVSYIQYNTWLDYVQVQGSNDNTNWTALGNGPIWNTYGSNLNLTYNYNLGSGQYTYLRFAFVWDNCSAGGAANYSFSQQVYGLAADQTTAQNALKAANAANSAAQLANTAAQNASTQASNASSYSSQALNWLNGAWGGYNLGTIGANAAASNSNASNAATQASNAYNQGVITNNYLTDGTNGLTAIKNQATSSYNQSLANNSQLTNSTYGLSAINSNITTTNTNVTNLANNMQYLIPPVLTKVFGYNGTTATLSTSFKVSMNYSGATEYQYLVDGSSWSTWTSLNSYNSSGYFTVGGINATGIHTVLIQLRNNNGSGIVSQSVSGEVTFFKI